MIHMKKKKKLGEGAYGVVYEAEIENEGEIEKVAVKRNYGDVENQGISCIRELNFLATHTNTTTIFYHVSCSIFWNCDECHKSKLQRIPCIHFISSSRNTIFG